MLSLCYFAMVALVNIYIPFSFSIIPIIYFHLFVIYPSMWRHMCVQVCSHVCVCACVCVVYPQGTPRVRYPFTLSRLLLMFLWPELCHMSLCKPRAEKGKGATINWSRPIKIQLLWLGIEATALTAGGCSENYGDKIINKVLEEEWVSSRVISPSYP